MDTLKDYSKPLRKFAVAVGRGERTKFDALSAADINAMAGEVAAKALAAMHDIWSCPKNNGFFTTCPDEFIKDWGRKLHRRGLTDAEFRIYRYGFDRLPASFTVENKLEFILQTMLQSTQMLHHFNYLDAKGRADKDSFLNRISYAL